MVHTVGFDRTTFGDPPYRFEAGTPNVAGAVGLAAALEFLEGVGRPRIAEHEAQLLDLAVSRLNEIPGVRIVGQPAQRAGVVSFVVDQPPMSALDVGTRLDAEGIAVRAGNHCCQPLMGRLGVAGTVRASFALYNTTEDVELFAATLRSIVGVPPVPRTAAPGLADEHGDVGPEPTYPGPTSRTIGLAAEAMLDELDSLDGWGERYEFLIELGRRTAPLPDSLRIESNRVRGCQSTVYIAARTRPGTRDVLEFLVDSNSEVVRGLLAVLQELFSGHRAGEMLAFDLATFLARGGLESNLTTGRRNGLAETIKRLRFLAESIVAQAATGEEPETA